MEFNRSVHALDKTVGPAAAGGVRLPARVVSALMFTPPPDFRHPPVAGQVYSVSLTPASPPHARRSRRSPAPIERGWTTCRGFRLPAYSPPTSAALYAPQGQAGAQVGSVRLELTGARDVDKTENIAPYSLYGDGDGNLTGQVLSAGQYTLKATAYAGASARPVPRP